VRRALAFAVVVVIGTLAFSVGALLGRGHPAASVADARRAQTIGAKAAHVDAPPVPAPVLRRANFGVESPSPVALYLADWIADSRDNDDRDFVIVDKRDARVYVFDPQSQLRGSSPVLIGSAVGDDSVVGIGSRPIAAVRPAERTTPAGRFLGELGRNSEGEDVVWVDYDAAVSMHRVRATNPRERRHQRLATPTSADNRVSYGCINVPVAFYDSYIKPTFSRRQALVYVLPEIKSVQQVFGSYTVATAVADSHQASDASR
jgi:hypothetical protein